MTTVVVLTWEENGVECELRGEFLIEALSHLISDFVNGADSVEEYQDGEKQ